MKEEPALPAPWRSVITIRWPRVLWVGVAAVLAVVGLWDGRTAVLGTQSAAEAVALHPEPTARAANPRIPEDVPVPGMVIRRTAGEVVAGNGLVEVDLDLTHGLISLRWPGTEHLPAVRLGSATLLIQARGITGSGPAGALLAADYRQHSVETQPFIDLQGSGLLVTLRHQDPRYPPASQQLRLYRASPALTVSASAGVASGPTLDVARIDALSVSGTRQIAVPGNTDPLVLALNGVTADHMPRQFVPLAALSMQAPLPYVTGLSGTAGDGTLLAGALSVTNWFPEVQIQHDAAGLAGISLSSIGPVSAPRVSTEPFLVGRFGEGSAALRAYALAAAQVSTPLRSSPTGQIGWSSWGAFEGNVNEVRVRRNADFMAAHLRSLGYDTIHIDDGWQRAYGDWQAGPRFPRGMQAMAKYLHARGLKASIWLAPFLTAPNAWPARQHPDWLLRNIDGSPIQVMVSSPTYVLDVSNPQVLQYVRTICARIRDWGFDSVKLDFLYTGSMAGMRYRFDLNGVQAYTAAMRVVRDTLEADPAHQIYLIGVQQGFLPSGFFQAWRVGRDIESKTNADHIPTWDLIRREALAVSTFAFADGVLYGNDPDDLLLRRVHGALNLTADELRTYATMVALGGGVWLSGDDLPSLAAQGRLGYLTNLEVMAVVRAGRAGVPIDVADQVTGPATIWNAAQAGGGTVVGLFNWGTKTRQVTVPLSDLGLRTGGAYRIRDLWARSDLGRTSQRLTVTLKPHQSALLRLAPLS